MTQLGQHCWEWGAPFKGPRGGQRCKLRCSKCGVESDTTEVARRPPGPCAWRPEGWEAQQKALAQDQWRRRSERAARTETLTVTFDPENPAEAAALLMARAAELMAYQAARVRSGGGAS